MKFNWLLLPLLFLLAACSTNQETDMDVQGENGIAKEQLMTLFEPGTYSGERMILALSDEASAEIEQIALTMQLSLVGHQDWYKEELDKLADGQPLPYDERLGVSEDEYNLLLAADDDLVPTKIGDTDVTVTQAKKQLKINCGTQTIIKDIAIANKGEKLITEIGELTYIDAVMASDDQGIGRWNGHHYRLGAADDTKTLHISLGELEESGKKIIQVEVLNEGNDKLEEFIIF